MEQSQMSASQQSHSRNRSGVRPIRPRTSTKGPLEADEGPLSAPLSPKPAPTIRLMSSRQASPRASPRAGSFPRSPGRSPAPTTPIPLSARDFSHLLRPEIFHQLTPLSVPAPFRNPAKQPSPETPIPDLLAQGYFRAAAIAAVQALTSSPVSATQAAAHPPVEPHDHARIFSLLYTRLACLCLIDAVPLAAQEAKALQDLNQGFYLDPVDGSHLMPWELRILAIRLQTLGFGDPRRAVMSFYDLAREARQRIARAGKAHDQSAKELWKHRLTELGIRVAGALVEMEDLAGAASHLASLKEGDARLATAKALLWLHLGDVDAARRCVKDGKVDQAGEDVVSALADMADGEYEAALARWQGLKESMAETGAKDEMVGVNLAVCLLYLGRMEEGRGVLEALIQDDHASHTLLFNLSTMYELCTDRAKQLKMSLAEHVADRKPSSDGWEKTNADFKL